MSKKLFRTAEFVLLFIGLPVVFYFNWVNIPKIAALIAVSLLCLVVLWLDPSYSLARLSAGSNSEDLWKSLAIKSGTVAVFLILLVLYIQPQALFIFPQTQPGLWLVIMVLYPVLSALPQELIYREFFFHRYGRYIDSSKVFVLFNAATFAFLHIVYDNIWAVVLAFAAGILFARTYQKERSLFWVAAEHAIYGCLVFTIGMGSFFFEGF